MEKIRIAVVEDDNHWLISFCNYLERFDYIEVVWTAPSRQEALKLVKSNDIDIILMDINLNGNRCEGIFAVIDIIEIKHVKVIMLSSLTDEEIIMDSFTAGAVNYVTKNNFRQIPGIIRNTFNEVTSMDILLKEFKRLKKEEQLKDLTSSEREVYDYIEKGYKQVQIQELLFKAESTLKAQVKAILRKLNVKTSRQAVTKVKNRGLIDD